MNRKNNLAGQGTWAEKKQVCERQMVLVLLLIPLLLNTAVLMAQTPVRTTIELNRDWKSVADDEHQHAFEGFEKPNFDDTKWAKVHIPHTWDQYEGYRRLLAGNRHGYAWYRKTFRLSQKETGKTSGRNQDGEKRYFLFFEGVGSYATVFLNGVQVGEHAGGRTTFTIDVTKNIRLNNQPNVLSVRADHPKNIQDLAWVDGGSSTERGFSEGSQPMGIFRPVSLLITNSVKVEPFGIHIWNDNNISKESALLQLNATIRNYGQRPRQVTVYNRLLDSAGNLVKAVKNNIKIPAGGTVNSLQNLQVNRPQLWSVRRPYLYTLSTQILENNKIIDDIKTPYGIRWISWPIAEALNKKQFLLNGEPLFINGVAEYEHLIGNSHAFSAEQVRSRVMQIKEAGFNAFRDAHQPHNLRYQEYWDQLGILSWTQLAAHIWYDTPEFRANFKTSLREWVKERRNSPSVVLWGLENESTLPEDFARECTEIIREMDPTASSQRKVTTCNGGKGTDWDVPQNWTGTYGGDPLDYAKDVERQVLIGEYGAWRTLDLHTEGPFLQNGPNSENRMAQLMETKIRLAEQAKDKTAGHFFWLFNSHDNPGRVQGGEGFRELDRVGPVNYKGLLTPWEEPLDVYYLFRANYAPKSTAPMVYIVSHTWPERWLQTGLKDSITVYSNCDEVELFNDVDGLSLGKRKRNGIGTHFQWDNVQVRYNVLHAVGYVNGKAVAKDDIVLNYLEQSPNFKSFYKDAVALVPEKGYKYLYRVNAGGPDYTDTQGNLWMADRQRTNKDSWGSTSWAADFPGTPAYFASQRRTFDPIKGTTDWKLFQTFRYGRNKLRFDFPVPDGEYLVELYFTEPWLGTGGGMDCTGWRLFDVAVNEQVVLHDLDIWKEAGHDAALKKTIKLRVTGGTLSLSFPEVKSGQALISAIAIASTDTAVQAAPASSLIVEKAEINEQLYPKGILKSWMDIGEDFSVLPPELFGALWFDHTTVANLHPTEALRKIAFTPKEEAVVYMAVEKQSSRALTWLSSFEDTQTAIRNAKGEYLNVYKKRYQKGEKITFEGFRKDLSFVMAVTPLSGLAPAYDLKSATNYTAVKAFEASKGVVKQTLMGKERLTFSQNEGSEIVFNVHVGVADTYSLTLKYHNASEKNVSATIEVAALDGTIMKKEEKLILAPTKEGKWNYVNTNTGTMINAGSYIIRLKSIDAIHVSIDGIEVQ
ncbi:malectin domain-containing carbohydrate-binding protein [Pedobacter sp. AW31-3R]|uniref:malectin domain-containing carbohydrate-binding protein n=1 Tax=Pedobacter sp. AW31-3R TaxID=3445781 RepID=UPI003F9F040D